MKPLDRSTAAIRGHELSCPTLPNAEIHSIV
jgi:hypothetical protein